MRRPELTPALDTSPPVHHTSRAQPRLIGGSGLSGGCNTGYVIEEETRFFQGAGTVYRVDGILLTEVATTLADDGYQPFHDGAYAIEDDGASLRVWYRPGRGVSPTGQVSTDGDPAFTLPKIESAMTSCATGGSGGI